jgi:hypothetical protein
MSLKYNQSGVRVYFDTDTTDVNAGHPDSRMTSADSGTWTGNFVSPLWDYQKKIYGSFGLQNGLMIMAHQNVWDYGAGSSRGRVANSPHWPNYRNYNSTADVVFNTTWNSTNSNAADLQLLKEFITHEMGHFVECSSNSVQDSCGGPSNNWSDSKFIEIFQYDILRGAGYTTEASAFYAKASASTNVIDNVPPGTTGVHWFNDFFYPLWRDRGGSRFLARYFQLARQYFPRTANGRGVDYARGMNFGEMIHFMSGAARTPLRTPGVGNGGQAYVAFNKPRWDSNWDTQLAKAKTDFPGITY